MSQTYDDLTDSDRDYLDRAPLSQLQKDLAELRESGSRDDVYLRAIAERILKIQCEVTRML